MIILCLLLWAGAVVAIPLSADPVDLPRRCGYESCTQAQPGTFNVHIVPHTHDDVGWLKTVDQYYYGSRNNIQKAGVQYILDSVISELWKDPNRRFIYVETAFFWKWWVRQTSDVQSKVHTLVSEGRLQFVGGAWSMNDEAASHYQSTIDQFTWGLRKLNETFGECGIPKVGWQIDPFGHSREFASLLAGMGYDGLFLGRIDYQDSGVRKRSKTMEMVWRGDDDMGKSSDLFTGVLYNLYQAPPGFCFDVLCDDEPIIDDPSSPMYNVENRVSLFIERVKIIGMAYTTNNILVTMGDDFNYQDAAMYFVNLDKLIQYGNVKSAQEGLNMKFFYSTPDCYLKAVKDANPILPTKQDDFFPYASDPHSYWTGYFTSRPTTKFFERQANNYLQISKQLQVLANLEKHNMFVLDELKSAMGVMQHHDAITGTEKQHVTHDYERLLSQAVDDALIIPYEALNKKMKASTDQPILAYKRCRFNESSCPVSENSESFIVTVYNSLGWTLPSTLIQLPVEHGSYTVTGPDGKTIPTQLLSIPDAIINIPTRESKATYELIFTSDLPPVGYKSFYVTKKQNLVKRDADDEPKLIFTKKVINIDDKTKAIDNDIKIDLPKVKSNFVDIYELEKLIIDAMKKIEEATGNNDWSKFYSLKDRMMSDETNVVEGPEDTDYIHLESGQIKLRIHKRSGITEFSYGDAQTYSLDVKMLYYPGCVGNNGNPQNRSSGAYIFRPNATTATLVKNKYTTSTEGPIVSEARFTMENAYSGLRLIKNKRYIEHDWVVGPIDITDDVGKEYISRIGITNLINNGEFYTDSNGRQMLKRKLNERPTWNVTIAEPIGGNYYPVNNIISILGNDVKLSVITDRSHGGSSLSEGYLELMVHRRLLHDDAFGVGEALNETAKGVGLVVRGKQRIFITDKQHQNEVRERMDVLELQLEPQLFVAEVNFDVDEYLKMDNEFSFVKSDLPVGVHMLTLEPWDDKILMRFENLFSDKLTKIDINGIFKDIKIKRFRETTLAANQWLNETSKWNWQTKERFVKNFNKDYGSFHTVFENNCDEFTEDVKTNIVLKKKQIRTFIVDYEL